jgi:hypothetical protein
MSEIRGTTTTRLQCGILSKVIHMSTTPQSVVDILVSQEFYLCWGSLPRFQYMDGSDQPAQWIDFSSLLIMLLIMLIILKSRSERKEFSWPQRFRQFWSTFSTNFYGIEIPRFHKIRYPNRYLRSSRMHWGLTSQWGPRSDLPPPPKNIVP